GAASPEPSAVGPAVVPLFRCFKAGPDDGAIAARLAPGGRAPVWFRASTGPCATSRTTAAIRPIPDILVIGKTPFMIQRCGAGSCSRRRTEGDGHAQIDRLR